MNFIIVLGLLFSCVASISIKNDLTDCFHQNRSLQLVCANNHLPYIQNDCYLKLPSGSARLEGDSIKIGGFGCDSGILSDVGYHWREFDMSSIGAVQCTFEFDMFRYKY